MRAELVGRSLGGDRGAGAVCILLATHMIMMSNLVISRTIFVLLLKSINNDMNF